MLPVAILRDARKSALLRMRSECVVRLPAKPSLRGAAATKQSRVPPTILDCFASLAMTVEPAAHPSRLAHRHDPSMMGFASLYPSHASYFFFICSSISWPCFIIFCIISSALASSSSSAFSAFAGGAVGSGQLSEVSLTRV